jgi:hypothetical protein
VRRMRRVRRMRVVARDHLEALILLFQDEFRSKGLSPEALGEEIVFASGRGATAVKGEALTPVAAIAPPTREPPACPRCCSETASCRSAYRSPRFKNAESRGIIHQGSLSSLILTA